MAKDTDSISSGSDDSGAHVKNMDEKIKTQTQTMTTTATTTTTLKSVEMSNVVKTSNTSTATMIKKTRVTKQKTNGKWRRLFSQK